MKTFFHSISILIGWIMIFQDVRNLFALIEATLMKEDKEANKWH